MCGCRYSLLLVYCFLSFGIFRSAANFRCSNGIELLMSQFCDGIPDCNESEDESVISTACQECDAHHQIRCSISNRTCLIDVGYLCNGSVSCEGISPCDVGCPTYFRCQNNTTCVSRDTVCDGTNLLQNGCENEDEYEGGVGFKCIKDKKHCRLPQQLLWDGYIDCDGGADLCYINADVTTKHPTSDLRNFSSTKFDHTKCFECLDGTMIVPRQKVCDDVIDCSDLSDECLCENSSNKYPCKQIIEKKETVIFQRDNKSCAVGQFDCGKGKCIDRDSICDSKVDCAEDALDESYSFCRGSLFCVDAPEERRKERCRCHQNRMYKMATLCNDFTECTEGPLPYTFNHNSADECPDWCSTTSENCSNTFIFGGFKLNVFCEETADPDSHNSTSVLYPHICDGIPDCDKTLMDENENECNVTRFFCKSGQFINIPKSQVCDGIIHCDDESDERNTDICANRFFCHNATGPKISIENEARCDFVKDCDDHSDEMNCTDYRFYCVDEKYPYYVRRAQVLDGKRDCADNSDECPMDPMFKQYDVFSSPYELIKDPVLRTLVWIMAFFALSGNLTVIAVECRNIRVIFRKRSSPASLKTYHILIANLALADFLMGIYLLSLGIAGVVFEGRFCLYFLSWQSGIACQALGSLVVLSSEASVITIAMLTSCRIFAVFKPFLATEKPSTKTTLILISLSWIFSFILAFIPFLPIFYDRVNLKNNLFFENIFVQISSAKTWVQKLLTYSPQLANASAVTFEKIGNSYSWSELQDIVANTSSKIYLEPTNYFGYYSAHSVCIPKIFVTTLDRAWRYSISISIFNFLAFIYVAGAYITILRKLKSNPKKKTYEPNRDKDIRVMQRKIIRLIATNFCCWVPISIMVFVNFSGFVLSSTSYAVSAIVLLPINSAINPILFFDIIEILSSRVKKAPSKESILRNRQSFTATGTTRL